MKLPPEIRHLAIEGVIGVGKSTLARVLAEQLKGRQLLEQFEENPFLERFYGDRRSFAFQTQLFFLLSRHRQFTEAFGQNDLFYDVTVSDYTFEKDRIFASANLDEQELRLYDRVAAVLAREVVKPDFLIYLQADVEVLLQRIRKRGRKMERDMDPTYLRQLSELYDQFFFHYKACPVLIVNTSRIDFVKNPLDLEALLQVIQTSPPGVTYYNPASLS